MFPNLGKNKKIFDLINASNGNVDQSKKIPWIRLTTSQGSGLILESLPTGDSLDSRYGLFQPNSSGAVGFDKSGNAVFMDEGGDYGQKFQPQPLIESLRVSQNANALSNKFEFSIVCHTLAQLDGITKYFMEPGYTVLVEFGWNTQDSITQRADVTQICEIANYERPDYVKNKVELSNGTYYGALGFITGGDVSSDGKKHTVSVTVTSIGVLPAYLQGHKGLDKFDSKKDPAENTYVFDQEKEIKNEKNIGKKLFRQMFNQLPASKKIKQVAALENIQDSRGESFSDPSNFINFDKEAIDMLKDAVSDIDEIETGYYISQAPLTRGQTTTTPNQIQASSTGLNTTFTGNIPITVELGGASDFFTTEPYIRLELAFAIINTGLINIQSVANKCNTVNSKNFTIDISETICSAHKYIFSTDASKLWIPNKHIPDFGLDYNQPPNKMFRPGNTTTKFKWDDVEKLTITRQGVSQSLASYIPGLSPVGGGLGPIITRRGVSYIHFPYEYDVFSKFNEFDPTGNTLKAYEFGYLKDLYINFNFFKNVIDKDNLVAKDVVLEILNGLASSVNSYWQFEIVDDKETGELKVSERNFVPNNLHKSTIKNDIPTLNALGVDSSALQINYKMDIPGAVASKVIGQRLSTQIGSEVREVHTDGLFTSQSDEVLKELNTFETSSVGSNANLSKQTDASIVGDAFKSLSNSITLLPKVKSYDDIKLMSKWYKSNKLDDADIKTILNYWLPAAYNDSEYLKYVENLYFNPNATNGSNLESGSKGILITSMGAEITLNGISGLRIGDIFFINGCPQRYKDYPFQITKVEHEVRNGGWVTNVEAGIRNIKL
jgi:hypothetical protein